MDSLISFEIILVAPQQMNLQSCPMRAKLRLMPAPRPKLLPRRLAVVLLRLSLVYHLHLTSLNPLSVQWHRFNCWEEHHYLRGLPVARPPLLLRLRVSPLQLLQLRQHSPPLVRKTNCCDALTEPLVLIRQQRFVSTHCCQFSIASLSHVHFWLITTSL